MKHAAKAILFTAFTSFTVTGCVCPFTPTTPTPTPIPTPTPAQALSGTYSGSVTETSTRTYSDGTPAVTDSRAVPVMLVYNSASVLTQWNRTLPGGSVIAISNPQVGTAVTYTDTVGGVSGTVTATIAQANYSTTSSTLSGTATFGSGSTGYSGNGTFVVTIALTSGGAKYTVVHSWTLVAPGGTPVITVSTNGSAVLPKS